MDGMDKFKVDKLKYPIILKMVDDSRIKGDIFLDIYSPIHRGRDMVQELMESEKSFFSLIMREDNSVVFINKVSVVKIILEERDSLEDLTLGKQKPVKIVLVDGEILSGKINLSIPGEKVRISDSLNSTSKCLYLYRNDQDVILNTSHIITVQPLP